MHIKCLRSLKTGHGVPTMKQDMKIGLALVAIALIAAGGAFLALRLIFPPGTGENGGGSGSSFTVKVIGSGGQQEATLNLSALQALEVTQGLSAYQNRLGNWGGNGTYTGVRLSILVELVGGIDSNDVVEVEASDGYTQRFAYYNLYPNDTFHAIQGDLILAYKYNGTIPPAWEDGPQIAFLPPDEAYSVEDANQTTHPAWFEGTGGGRWVKRVSIIRVIADAYPPSGLYKQQAKGEETILCGWDNRCMNQLVWSEFMDFLFHPASPRRVMTAGEGEWEARLQSTI